MNRIPDRLPARGPATAFGFANLLSAALVTLGVFEGLPSRYRLVDGLAILLSVLLSVSGVGLVARVGWGPALGRVAAGVTLAVGLVLVGALALAAGYLAGIYGPVGQGGVVIFTLVIGLATPYLVVLPGLELYWLQRRTPP
jgi:hypothetical protein